VVSFAGKFDEGEARDLAESHFGSIEGKKQREFPPLDGYGTEKVFLRDKNTEQTHLVLGVPGVSSQDENHFPHKLLSIVLGGNMSSRMFLNIREAKGMCYYIDTDTDSYLDDQSRLNEAISLIIAEYDKVANDGIDEDELERAKSFLKGKITLSLEDTEELAHFLGKQQLLYPKVWSVDDYFKKIESVTADQVNDLAKELLAHENLRLSVIGKTEGKEALESLLS
jgi:predicted Zn-dependent peptidase